MGDSWEAWYLNFEEINLLLDSPIPIRGEDIQVLRECFEHGVSPDEALENFRDSF